MSDEDLVRRFDALEPLPSCRQRPAGCTRLLVLRVHALRLQRRIPSTAQGEGQYVLASDLGSVLLAYLGEQRVPIELHRASMATPNLSLRGLVSLRAIQILVPPLLAEDRPLPPLSSLSGALRMSPTLVAWAIAGELHRLEARTEEVRKWIARAGDLTAEWIGAYPDLVCQVGTPKSVERELSEHELSMSLEDAMTEPPEPATRPRRRRAGTWVLADQTAIEQRLSELAASKQSKPMLEPLLRRLEQGCERRLQRANLGQAAAVERLIERFPNFDGVCRWVADQIRLCILTREPFRLPPVLLLGAPGIGKTMFCHVLAEALEGASCVRSLAELSASWLITGASTQWANGRPGVIADHLSRCPTDRVPWFIFDELDKAAGDRGYPLGPALLGLLEPYTAQRFRDEALEIEMDIRPACFIFTANDRSRVRPELISRLHVIEVRAPTATEMPAVVASVDAQLRREQPQLAKVFAPLSTPLLSQLGSVSPRELRRVLQGAYATAARRTLRLRGLRTLLPEDLPAEVQKKTDRQTRTLH